VGRLCRGKPTPHSDWYIICGKTLPANRAYGKRFPDRPLVAKPSLNTLSLNGKTIHIEPKVMEVLVCLADEGGETISKEKLLETVCAGHICNR
jgi:DNA-binding response OmpR family regulator